MERTNYLSFFGKNLPPDRVGINASLDIDQREQLAVLSCLRGAIGQSQNGFERANALCARVAAFMADANRASS
jgi:hypothetical protein